MRNWSRERRFRGIWVEQVSWAVERGDTCGCKGRAYMVPLTTARNLAVPYKCDDTVKTWASVKTVLLSTFTQHLNFDTPPPFRSSSLPTSSFILSFSIPLPSLSFGPPLLIVNAVLTSPAVIHYITATLHPSSIGSAHCPLLNIPVISGDSGADITCICSFLPLVLPNLLTFHHHSKETQNSNHYKD